ncbi:hypothetical protein K501DRAFT_174989 [Backusella circina FSU 941]|nr:hypothetical protein K501DRAFT_174989 [Backusella circina FSU 941]
MRTKVIHEIIQHNTKASETQIQRTTHQLREIILIIKRTVTQAYDIFYSKERNHKQTLIESFVQNFQKTFLIPSKLSHGNETPSQPAITRVFSPSSNVHLIVRYLPEVIQNYTPEFDPAPVLKPEEIQKMVQHWLESIRDALQIHLPNIFKPLDTESGLVKVRSRVWELLDQDENTKDIKNNKWQTATQNLVGSRYSLWDVMLRDVFNNHAKEIINKNFEALSVQPSTVVWPLVTDKNQKHTKKDFSVTVNVWPGMNTTNSILPSLSSSQEIENFKKSLRETSHDRTDLLYKLQESFDSVLAASRKDVQAHFSNHEDNYFHAVDDTNMIKTYFQDSCYQAVLKYADELKLLFAKIDSWADKQAVNDLSIFFGRLAKNIAMLSKELPKALLLTDESTPVFELRSGVNKDPRLNEIQKEFTNTYHEAHKSWINEISSQFGKSLRNILLTAKWNDQCSSVLVWQSKFIQKKKSNQANHQWKRCGR